MGRPATAAAVRVHRRRRHSLGVRILARVRVRRVRVWVSVLVGAVEGRACADPAGRTVLRRDAAGAGALYLAAAASGSVNEVLGVRSLDRGGVHRRVHRRVVGRLLRHVGGVVVGIMIHVGAHARRVDRLMCVKTAWWTLWN